MAKYRAQILLEPEQHAVLVRLAEAQRESISGVVREIVGKYLEEMKDTEQRERERRALEKLAQLRKKIGRTRGTLAADWLKEDREERNEEISRRMRQDR